MSHSFTRALWNHWQMNWVSFTCSAIQLIVKMDQITFLCEFCLFWGWLFQLVTSLQLVKSSHQSELPSRRMSRLLMKKKKQKATGQICLLHPFGAPKLHHMRDAEENSKKYQARQSGMVRKLSWKYTENILPWVSSSSLCTHCLLCVNSSLLN